MNSEKGEGEPLSSEVENSIKHPSASENLSETDPSGQVRRVYALLLAVSFLMILCTAILKLDYLTGVLIGCLLIILNFHWTARFVHNLIRVRKVQAMNLIFYLSKFAFSAFVLFGALIYFDFPPLALLLGLSNIVIAVTIYSVITSIRNPA
ncbi:uncharacterized protein METZ01_LOCUS392165 [marine metagenome]|uniref:ATP synthase subunit I n=1 Tax=marine metagenome TaxID=408172 RepID=A0A382V080_9ZZZZ